MELREWKYMNASKATTAPAAGNSTGYKKRFEKLIKYHLDHCSSELESILKKDIDEYGFHLKEHWNTGYSEYDRAIVVIVDKATDEFSLSIYLNNREVNEIKCKGYTYFVRAIEPYMFLPDFRTQEYAELLTEWKAMNPQANTSQPASVSSPKTNREKFTELTTYMQKYKDSSVIFASVMGPTNLGFEYEEQRSGYNLSVEVSLRKHDLFTIHIYKDSKIVESIMAKGWEDFLRYLKKYFSVPPTGSPEYKSLTESFLNEWKTLNSAQQAPAASSTTGGYWERFNKLIYYHVTHKDPFVDKVLKTKVRKDGFHYAEHHRGGATGYETEVVVDIDLATDAWTIQTYIDGQSHSRITGTGYLELLKELRLYMKLPAERTSDYDKLLTEELLEWRSMNPPQPAQVNNTFDNTYRYQRLLAQIDADSICTYTVNDLNDTTLDINVNTRLKNNFNIKIIYVPTTDTYTFQVNGIPNKGWDYEEDILPLLVSGEVINNTDLCESAGSGTNLHEEFKEYAEMWDTLNEWVDSKGNKVNINSSSASAADAKPTLVYTWSIWTGSPPYERGRWTGAKFKNGVLEGEVFSTPEKAEHRGEIVLLGVPGPERFTVEVLSFSAVLTDKVKLLN